MRMMTKEDRIAYRAVLAGKATLHPKSNDTAAVYVAVSVRGLPCAMGFIGTAGRPAFNFSFKTEEQMQQHIEHFFKEQEAGTKARAERRAAVQAFTHTLKVGDILFTSWGYDQTNIEHFEVTRIVSSKSVAVRQVAADLVETGFMCGQSTAKPGHYVGPEKVCRVGHGNSCANIDGNGHHGFPSTTLTHYCSWYA